MRRSHAQRLADAVAFSESHAAREGTDVAAWAERYAAMAESYRRLAAAERALYEYAASPGQRRTISRRANADERRAEIEDAQAAVYRNMLEHRRIGAAVARLYPDHARLFDPAPLED